MSTNKLKICLVGDSAAGKTALLEFFLFGRDHKVLSEQSTTGVDMFEFTYKKDGVDWLIEFWDAAGQDDYDPYHPSFFFCSDCCIFCFDSVRRITYKNLKQWYRDMISIATTGSIPCFVFCNKVDLNPDATKRTYKFATERNFPLFFTSAADGTNVVQGFTTAIDEAIRMRAEREAGNVDDLVRDVMDVLE
ncbi:hypothetical protein PCE1_000009 [Barthelona sp. PCE]